MNISKPIEVEFVEVGQVVNKQSTFSEKNIDV